MSNKKQNIVVKIIAWLAALMILMLALMPLLSTL